MTFLKEDILKRVMKATGKDVPAENSVHGLADLPADIARDLEIINRDCGSVCAFAFLYHVTDASFSEVKLYLDEKGWHSNAD